MLVNESTLKLLRSIPGPTQDAQSILSWCEVAGAQPSFGRGIVSMLELFGSIVIENGAQLSDAKIKAKSKIAKYFHDSLAAYLAKHSPLVTDWETKGVSDTPIVPSEVLRSGATLLNVLESKREKVWGYGEPLVQPKVSSCIITTKVHRSTELLYLFHFDTDSNAFQLVGGGEEPDDKDVVATVIREIGEELQNRVVNGKDYTVTPLLSGEPIVVNSRSNSHGALSSYSITLFHMQANTKHLPDFGHSNRWLTLKEILKGRTNGRNGDPIKNDVHKELVEEHKGLLDKLDPSFSQPLRRSLRQKIATKRGSWITVFIGLMAIPAALLIAYPGNTWCLWGGLAGSILFLVLALLSFRA